MQRDALGELFNIGVGRAANSLSMIVREEVELSAPSVSLVHPKDVASTLLGSDLRELSMVTIDFAGPFDAQTILLFPERNALAIVSHMLDPDMTPEEMSEFEQEAMCEVGNIILNACISSLADEFQVEFEGGLPEHHFSDSDGLPLFGEDRGQVILLLQIQLGMRQERMQGHLLFLLSVSSMQALLDCVDQYLERLGMG
nr:chemotaxis protein CheX [Thiocystis violacea]